VPDLFSDIMFLFQRIRPSDILDLVLVTLVFYTILMLVRETQAVVLLRGVILLIILLSLMTGFVVLPAFPG
jgi:diadenylate cyclase